MNNKKIIVFIDFDGVLCDSVKEAYLLSRYAYYDIDVHSPIDLKLYQKFANNRYLISNSWQYYYLMYILDKFALLDSKNIQIEFKKIATKSNDSDNFNIKFLIKRKELIEKDFDFWNSLESPTLFMNKLSKILNNTKKCTFSILSTKNKNAIITKFNQWKIQFNPLYIYDKQDLHDDTKGNFILNYLNSNKCFYKAILIDDNEDNINSCKNIKNIFPILTSWGYNQAKTGLAESTVINIIKEVV